MTGSAREVVRYMRLVESAYDTPPSYRSPEQREAMTLNLVIGRSEGFQVASASALKALADYDARMAS